MYHIAATDGSQNHIAVSDTLRGFGGYTPDKGISLRPIRVDLDCILFFIPLFISLMADFIM
jgi:hypothetical protein